jgi:hypothetical protein
VDNFCAVENAPEKREKAFIIYPLMWISLRPKLWSDKTRKKSNMHFYTFMNGCPQFYPIYPRFCVERSNFIIISSALPFAQVQNYTLPIL